MRTKDLHSVPPEVRGFPGRFLLNGPRKVALAAGVAAIVALIIGAGFAGISSSGYATSLETAVVRWTALGCLAVGAVAYLIGGRMLRDGAQRRQSAGREAEPPATS